MSTMQANIRRPGRMTLLFWLTNVFISLFTLQGCTNNEKEVVVTPEKTKLSKNAKEAPRDNFSPEFRILFLRNYKSRPDSNQLEMFLTRLNDNPKIAVFQFLHTEKNELTLVGYVGKQHQTNFEKFPFVPILEISDWTPANKIDLTDKNVILTNQVIGKGDGKGPDPIKVLEGMINQPGYEYITFTPRLAPGSRNNTYFVVYDLGYMSTLPTAAFHAAGATITRLNLSLNPSPPRNSF